VQTKRKPIRSYVLRQGRLTNAQQNALNNHWSKYGINYNEQLLQFESIFHRKAPIVLEIGFGNGDSLLEQAVQQPESDFIGIEVHRPGVGHLLHRIKQAETTNLRVMHHDATEVIQHQIAVQSLNCVQLFFPDPWHKKRHHKRRILQASFINLIHSKLVAGGLFHMATDWEHYAVHMMDEMGQSKGFVNTAGKGNFVGKTQRPQTKFELRGRRLGHEVFDLVFEKAQ